MPERAIYLTSQDRDRLQALSQMTGDKDRGDLAGLMYELSRAVVVPAAANFAEGKISVVAPIGAAMIGYRVGDEIEWEVPAGQRHFRVEAVLYQPEAAGDDHL